METIVRSLPELQALRERAARRNVSRVLLLLPLPPDQTRDGEKVINRHLRSLGYETAVLLFAAGFAITTVRLVLAHLGMSARPTLIGAAAFLLLCAIMGRIGGIAFAEWRLRATIDRLTVGLD
jgi:hypothetical protein